MTATKKDRQGQTGGQVIDAAGQLSSTRKILPFRPKIKDQPEPTHAGFDRNVSARLALITHLIEQLRAEKGQLESLVKCGSPIA